MLFAAASGTTLTAQEPTEEPKPAAKTEEAKSDDVPMREVEGERVQRQDDRRGQRQDDRRVRRLTRPRSTVAPSDARGRFGIGFGYGRFRINARELGGRDSADAALFRLDGEFWLNRHVGFGLMGEMFATDDELFEGQQVESGVGLRRADAEVNGTDLTAFVAFDPIGGDRVRFPLQVGPWVSSTFLDYDSARIDYTFSTAGIRVGARPELTLVDTDRADVVLFGGASYAIAFASVYEDLIGDNSTYDSEAQQFQAEGGIRVDLRHVSLGLQYVLNDVGVNLSDFEDGRRVPDVDFHTHMFFFTVAGRF